MPAARTAVCLAYPDCAQAIPAQAVMIDLDGTLVNTLGDFDLALNINRPVFRFLFSIEMFTDSSMIFFANDSTPYLCTVFVFSLINRCHSSYLMIFEV